LSDIAPTQPALEFAIGTGRIALPLAARGVQVDGIELSPQMIERLRAKAGGADLHVVCGDMSTVSTERRYGLVYLVFNTIFNLLTVDDQINCFVNAARHLDGDGVFVVETALPHTWMPSGTSDYVHAEQVNLDSVMFDVAKYDPVTQLLAENHVRIAATIAAAARAVILRFCSFTALGSLTGNAAQRNSSTTGQWSEPATCGRMRAALTRGTSAGETRK
jgi:SAM-dependent methyltransferase